MGKNIYQPRRELIHFVARKNLSEKFVRVSWQVVHRLLDGRRCENSFCFVALHAEQLNHPLTLKTHFKQVSCVIFLPTK